MRLAAATRVLRGTVPESAILPLLFPQLRTAHPTLGTRQLLQAYAEMPWFRAVCDKTADAVASVRWRVLAVKPQGQTRFVRPLGIQRAGFLERAKRLKTHQLPKTEKRKHFWAEPTNGAAFALSFRSQISIRLKSMLPLTIQRCILHR